MKIAPFRKLISCALFARNPEIRLQTEATYDGKISRKELKWQ